MGFRRYIAPSAREALERIRKELGPEAVILSNRRSAAGKVEIIAAAQGEMRALVEELEPADGGDPAHAPKGSEADRPGAVPVRRTPPESFQEFIRRQATVPAPRLDALAMYTAVAKEDRSAAAAAPAAPRSVSAAAAGEPTMPAVFRRRPSRLAPEARAAQEPAAARAADSDEQEIDRPAPATATPASRAQSAPAPAAAPAAAAGGKPPVPTPAQRERIEATAAAAPAIAVSDARVMAELQSLRSALTDRISHLETKIVAKPAPERIDSAAQGQLGAARQAMTRLLMSGFSPELARRVGDVVPAALDAKDVDKWLQEVIARHIRCPGEADNPICHAGAIALVGPTGVGKTTTIAKLAARFVVRHGAAALGLVTLDSYRIGGHEQLRSYGRILGVPVHNTHDAASLRDLLMSLHGKRQVLIDTCGVSQRDQRLAEMMAMLNEVQFADQKIRRVLLINAASHAETLDEVARAWHLENAHGTILTKIDEAARIGGALDAILRYQAPLLGLTNGQRVPEDWHPGNPPLLAHIALKPFGAAFDLGAEELHSLSGRGALLA